MDELNLPPTDLIRLRDEILSQPPCAALPSALSDDWLQLIARDLEDAVGDCAASSHHSSAAAPLALILHLLSSRTEGSSLSVPLEDMYRYFCHYRIEIGLEMVRRGTHIKPEPATLETIFSNRMVMVAPGGSN